MAGGGDSLLGNDDFVADRAMLALGQTVGGAGGGNSGINDLSVAGGGDNFSGDDDSAAEIAVGTASAAVGGAGGSNLLIGNLRVAQRGDSLLSDQNGVSDRTMLALGQAGFGASGSNSGIDDLRVAGGGNLFLLDQNLIADGAILTLGLAGLGAGGCNSGLNDLGMAGGDDLLLDSDLTADGALLAVGQTVFLTGLGIARDDLFGVAGGGNGLLSNDDLVAARAVLALGLAGGGAGGCNSGVNDLGMAQCGDLVSGVAVAAGAGMGGVALLRAGGGSDGCGVGVDMDGVGIQYLLESGDQSSMALGSGVVAQIDRAGASISKYGIASVGCIVKCGIGIRNGVMSLYAAAVRKQLVEDYYAALKKAGLTLKQAMPVEMAWLNAITQSRGLPQKYAIVDLGHHTSRVSIFAKGDYIMGKDIEMGGSLLDETIAQNMNMDTFAARTRKESNMEKVLDSEFLIDSYNRIALEVMKAINFYNFTRDAEDTLLKDVYVCGGSSFVEPLCTAIEKATDVRISPISRMLDMGGTNRDMAAYCALSAGAAMQTK